MTTRPRLTIPFGLHMGMLVLGAFAITALTYGLVTDPARAWASYLTSAFFFLTIALGGAVFIAMNAVASAGWHTAIKRVPEALTTYLPVGAITMLVVLMGIHSLYHWSHAEVVAADPILTAKAGYLNTAMYAGKMIFFLAGWTLFGFLLRYYSRKQDQDGDIAHTGRIKAVSAIFIVFFAITFSFASFDWLMSTEPHWFSTIYGFYNLAGVLVGGTAAITVICIMLRRRGLLPGFNENHLHDLAKLLFGFSTFWAYMWLSQYLLIWYANIPEEVGPVVTRLNGGWAFLFWLNIILGWVVPFAALLPRNWKRIEPHVLWVCGVLLLGRWLDIYIEVAPGSQPNHIGLGWQEVGLFLGFVSLFGWVVVRGLRAAPIIAKNDPFLVEALHHEQ